MSAAKATTVEVGFRFRASDIDLDVVARVSLSGREDMELLAVRLDGTPGAIADPELLERLEQDRAALERLHGLALEQADEAADEGEDPPDRDELDFEREDCR